MQIKPGFLAFLAMDLVCLAGLGFAGTAASNLTVSASVAAACQVTSVGNISFGSYDPLNALPNDAAGSMVFRCVKGTSYRTYISGTRVMTGSGNSLAFQLYADSGRTSVFASNNTGGSVTAPSISPITQSIYGRISASQDVPAANYSSVLVVTVEY